MTTRRQAEAVLFDKTVDVFNVENVSLPEVKTSTVVDNPDRRRVDAIHCPICAGWVEVRLQPVRLHCNRCGLEAKP